VCLHVGMVQEGGPLCLLGCSSIPWPVQLRGHALNSFLCHLQAAPCMPSQFDAELQNFCLCVCVCGVSSQSPAKARTPAQVHTSTNTHTSTHMHIHIHTHRAMRACAHELPPPPLSPGVCPLAHPCLAAPALLFAGAAPQLPGTPGAHPGTPLSAANHSLVRKRQQLEAQRASETAAKHQAGLRLAVVAAAAAAGARRTRACRQAGLRSRRTWLV